MKLPRHIALVGGLALVAASASAVGIGASKAMADTPAGPYTVVANGSPVVYHNINGVSGWPDPNGPPAAGPCSSADPAVGGSCDRQTVHFQAGSAPTSDTFSLAVSVSFTQKDPTLVNCLDLAIEDAGATTVFAHQNCAGSGGSVTAANIAPNADYTIEIDADAQNGAIVMAQPFDATLTGSAVPATGPAPTPVPTNPFGFTHEISVDVQHGDGEPDLAIANDNKSFYASTPYGFSTTVSLMYKSSDGGVQWDNLHGSAIGQACPLPAALVLRPDCSRGGGDSEIQLSQPGVMSGPQRVQFEDLNGLDSISCAYSDDGGDTFHDLAAFAISGNPVPGAACNEGGTVPPTCQTVPPPTSTCGTLGTDRQWVAVWPKADQPSGTADHLFMTFDTGDQPPSGDAAIYSTDNGNTWTAACTTLTGPSCLGGSNGVGSRPGPLVINPTLLNTVTAHANVLAGTYPTLYEFMGTNSNGTEVNISCDGGQTWSNVATSNGQAGSTTNDFVVGTLDSNGEVYTAYAVANGSSPWRVYFAHSTNSAIPTGSDCSVAVPGGGRWSTPVALTGPPSTSDGVGATPIPGQNYAVMPWITAGAAGRLDLVYYGTSDAVGLSPDTQAATWFLHMAQSLDGGATWTDEQATETPMHVKSICFSGIGCTAQTPPGGDRNLLDFFQVKLDAAGRAVIIFTDDNNTAACAPTCSPGIGLISEVQQASGPSLFGGSVGSLPNSYLLNNSVNGDVRQAGVNADVPDPAQDAVLASPGHNILGTDVPAADITDLKVCTTHTASCPVANTAANTLAFLFTVADLSGGPGSAVVTADGSTSANWLVTWRSNNDLWYAQAVSDPAGTLSCTYGRPQSVFNDGEPKAVEYVGNPEAMHIASAGCVADTTANTIEIDVPMDATSGLSSASELFGLTGWTGNSTTALPATVCMTAPGGNDCSGPLGFFNNIDETAPLDVVISSTTVTPEVPSVPLVLGLGALAMAGGGILRRRRRSLGSERS